MSDNNDAQDYTKLIAEELQLLELALESPDNLPALFGADDYDAEELAFESAVINEYINRFCLAMSIRVDQRGADYGATILLTRTIGGPNCYIERDTEDGTAILVTTYYGGENNSTRLYLDLVSNWLDAIVTEE